MLRRRAKSSLWLRPSARANRRLSCSYLFSASRFGRVHIFSNDLHQRAAQALGDKGKGLVSGALVVTIVLMVIGYRTADGAVLWGRSPALVGINNLLMLLALYIYAASVRGTRIYPLDPPCTADGCSCLVDCASLGQWRYPVIRFVWWAAVWSVVQMLVINRAEGPRAPYVAPAMKSEVLAGVISVVAFSLVAGHSPLAWLQPVWVKLVWIKI
jgi:hypothetical protein